jgi:hypothetical protein
MTQLQKLEQLKERVRPFLRKYLESRGVTIQDTGHFLCINPRHNDKNTPSGHIVPDTNDSFWT